MRILKKILLFLFVLIFLIVAGLTIFLLTFDLNRYKSLAETKLTELLNRPVTIESMDTKLALIPTISIKGFKIANNDPFTDKAPLLYVQRMEAVLELAPLLVSQINIHSVDIESADINLLQNGTANNWTLEKQGKTKKTEQPAGSKDAAKKNLNLSLAQIRSLNINFDNGKIKQQATINKLELKALHILSGEITYNKQTMTVSLNTGSIFDLMNQVPDFPLDLKVQSRLFNATINGKIGNFKEFKNIQATISCRTNNLKNLLNFFKVSHTMIPPFNTQLQLNVEGDLDTMKLKRADFNINGEKDFNVTSTGKLTQLTKNPTLVLDFNMQLQQNKLCELWKIPPMNAKGDLTLTKNSAKTTKITLDANRSDMRFSGDIQWNKDTYKIQGALASDFLDIEDFEQQEVKAATSTTSASSSSNSPLKNIRLPWSDLKKWTANLSINIAHLYLGQTLTDYISINTKPQLAKGNLNMPFDIGMLSGKVSGTLTANASTQAVTIKASGNQLNMNGLRPINQEVQDLVLLAAVSGNTKGQTAQSLLDNLDGRIILQTNQGQIINKWFVALPKALNLQQKKQNSLTFSNGDSRVAINCAAANFQIQKGVISGADQLALETNTLNILAGGKVDLIKKTMDVTLWPSLPEHEKTDDWTSLTKMIRISGPFDQLTPRIDMNQATNDLVRVGLSKLAGIKSQNEAKVTGAMCQNVLGKYALQTPKKQVVTPQKTQQTTKTQTQKTPTKQEFQDQLLNTLFQALSK